ncbi:LOW QUALITY PROTEIN: family 3 glycoside hydrolase [Microdochium trichocladiopsis]|uniref:beta-glucosidase n=1 Tax=Microdochium trichocladiopsis TaxID=1682393 RepID=A0A9P8Y9N6_9PEZI|nr:LOW QUALITY PROTEIN: family 3 glycoside hydrolase [Microdochium trichocladiopsis]KAH7033647.1 LOW QUALITY PROTEIN: family 3 glycoside hydrolase [Microdochium trichocladiopsis]
MGNTDIEAVLQSLTLEEKISLLAGANFWETVQVPGKVPSVKTSDGPNGARGADFTGGTPAACFPAASCVAATFDTAAAFKVGEALADETHSKGARCLLAPTVCIHRHPLGGRNFESFSEDPFLAGKLSSQIIQGVQSKGVAATIKHFAVNEQETDRFTVNETVSERALREIYLRPFEIAVKEAKPWAVMTAYNCVNGTHCDSNDFLLKQVLRGDWAWDGLVMSDWGGTNSTADAINSGLDLEMPGPTLRRKPADVIAAIQAGKTTKAAVDERVRRVLKFLDILKDPETPKEQAIDKPEVRALIRETAAHGAVLLKNANQVLPLSKEKVKGKKIAVLGLAKTPLAHGGGSASVNAHYKISPWDALQSALGDSAELSFSSAFHTQRLLSPINKDNTEVGTVTGLDGKPGWTIEWHDLKTDEVASTSHGFNESNLPLGTDEGFGKAINLIADFIPAESGAHYMGCTGLGSAHVYINDKLVFDQGGPCKDAMGFIFGALSEEEFTYDFTAGEKYRIVIKSDPPTGIKGLELLNDRPGIRLGFQLAGEHDKDLTSEAVENAKNADYALIFTGHDPKWETEGQDQASFNLPRQGSQDALIAAVSKVNKNVVVVNSTGVAVAMPWLDDISGLVQAWFGGQECGNSIADVLTGKTTPEGNLPISFPRCIEDAPAHGNFPGEYDAHGQLQVTYKEGVFVGYRHYDRLAGGGAAAAEVLNFPFGFGLSYTTFDFGELRVSPAPTSSSPFGAEYDILVEVSNTGAVGGGVLVQVYAGPKDPAAHECPVKQLVAFQKVRLQPGEKKAVSLKAAVRDLGFFDETKGKWVVPKGGYKFSLGRSAAELVKSVEVEVGEELVFDA